MLVFPLLESTSMIQSKILLLGPEVVRSFFQEFEFECLASSFWFMYFGLRGRSEGLPEPARNFTEVKTRSLSQPSEPFLSIT